MIRQAAILRKPRLPRGQDDKKKEDKPAEKETASWIRRLRNMWTKTTVNQTSINSLAEEMMKKCMSAIMQQIKVPSVGMSSADETSSAAPQVEVTNSKSVKGHSSRSVKDQQSEKNDSKDYIKLTPYDGETELEIFLELIETCRKHNRWSEERTYGHVQAALRGKAAKVLMKAKGKTKTLDDLIKELERRFGNEGQAPRYRELMRSRRRQPNETLVDLYADFDRLGMLAYPDVIDKIADELITDAFCTSLDEELEGKVRDKEPPNLDEAYKYAVRFESRRAARKNNAPNKRRNEDQHAFAVTIESDEEEDSKPSSKSKHFRKRGQNRQANQNKQGPQNTARICALETKLEEVLKKSRTEETKSAPQSQSQLFPVASSFVQQPNSNLMVPVQRRPLSEITCFNCGERGHYANQCTFERSALVQPQRSYGEGRPGHETKRPA